jgi:hypothetical protein
MAKVKQPFSRVAEPNTQNGKDNVTLVKNGIPLPKKSKTRKAAWKRRINDNE